MKCNVCGKETMNVYTGPDNPGPRCFEHGPAIWTLIAVALGGGLDA